MKKFTGIYEEFEENLLRNKIENKTELIIKVTCDYCDFQDEYKCTNNVANKEERWLAVETFIQNGWNELIIPKVEKGIACPICVEKWEEGNWYVKESKEETKENYLSIDAETDGLWGDPFSIAAILYDNDGNELDKICVRLPNEVVTDKWVIKNVIPTLNFPETHKNYKSMLKDFSNFYMKYKESTVIWHMGHVVESHLFREMRKLKYIGDWDAPYCPIEIAGILKAKGFKNPDSVDEYAKNYNIVISDYGSTHNPLYDCEIAAKVFFHATKKKI